MRLSLTESSSFQIGSPYKQPTYEAANKGRFVWPIPFPAVAQKRPPTDANANKYFFCHQPSCHHSNTFGAKTCRPAKPPFFDYVPTCMLSALACLRLRQASSSLPIPTTHNLPSSSSSSSSPSPQHKHEMSIRTINDAQTLAQLRKSPWWRQAEDLTRDPGGNWKKIYEFQVALHDELEKESEARIYLPEQMKQWLAPIMTNNARIKFVVRWTPLV